MISERTKAALKAAKARGVVLGSSPDLGKARRAASEAAERHAEGVLPLVQPLRAHSTDAEHPFHGIVSSHSTAS
jgi:DNA invertase Pin-like site-specific DNA recombinase